jgi:hypothetical protein
MMYLLVLAGNANAHEWTPTYPVLQTSHVRGISKVQMHLFNAREDVWYYTFEVLDKDFNPLPYATGQRTIHLPYLGKKNVEIYIRDEDRLQAVYVCSRSKIVAKDVTATVVSSKICSKIK